MDKIELDSEGIQKAIKLQQELEAIEESEAINALNKERIKANIIALNSKYEFPEKDSKSEIVGRLKVTYPEANYGLDFQKFIDIFGMELFLRCFTISKAELNVEVWREMVRNEEVVETDLLPCITDPRELKPRITLMKGKDFEEDEED